MVATVLTVAPAATAAPSTTTLASSPNPSLVGQAVTLTATVEGDAPTGDVTFADGATPLATVPLDGAGTAVLVTSALTAGSHTLTASYAGDAGNDPSSDEVTQVVNNPPTATTTKVTSTANPSVAGKAVALKATVTGAAPTGKVTFSESGRTLGTRSLSGGVATLVVSSWRAGTHKVTATYSGDPNNLGSAGSLTQQVTKPVKKPRVWLKVSDTKVSVGDKIRISWRSKHADRVKASGDWHGGKKAKGSQVVRITERGKHVFKLAVSNSAGRDKAKVIVLAARKPKEFELKVTDKLVLVGTDVDITAGGLAKGETYTVRLDGKVILTGKADKRGDVKRTFELAKTTPEGALPLTLTGSNPRRLGTATLNVIKPKRLDVEVESAKVAKRQDQTVTVSGLMPGEDVKVNYAGKRLTTGKADKDGSFSYTFDVGRETGRRAVKVVGAVASRIGKATFKVYSPNDEGGNAGARFAVS